MEISQETLAEAEAIKQRMAERAGADRRAVICACGHPIGKHGQLAGRALCKANATTCPCRETRPVLKAPNARAFTFKTTEEGHAAVKGIGKASEMGDLASVEWVTTCGVLGCVAVPVTVVTLDGGRTNEPRCGEHR